ncbi:hypothetical protein LguiA_022161 [Lonicera macranthoides]
MRIDEREKERGDGKRLFGLWSLLDDLQQMGKMQNYTLFRLHRLGEMGKW